MHALEACPHSCLAHMPSACIMWRDCPTRKSIFPPRPWEACPCTRCHLFSSSIESSARFTYRVLRVMIYGVCVLFCNASFAAASVRFSPFRCHAALHGVPIRYSFMRQCRRLYTGTQMLWSPRCMHLVSNSSHLTACSTFLWRRVRGYSATPRSLQCNRYHASAT